MDYYYLALTESRGEIEMADGPFESLNEAKEWIEDMNTGWHHYAYSSKIIMINCNDLQIMNVYFINRIHEQPRADIDWHQKYE